MIKEIVAGQAAECCAFLSSHSDANYAHDPVWIRIIRDTYGKDVGILVDSDEKDGHVRGVAPYAFLTSPLKKKLVCLPYLDYGGPLGETPEITEALWRALRDLALSRRAELEIRSAYSLPNLPSSTNEKVRMVLSIGGNSDAYWKSLDAKVRNQVRKAEKSGVTVRWGREEMLSDFYTVFCLNMRDLGSPVHDVRIFKHVLAHFPGAEIGTAYREGRCIGGLFRILWNRSLVIPWASTLREERIHSPNNALYWESIRFAFEKQCTQVDFGRSSRGEGTYNFKKQWLAEESALHWYPFDAAGNPRNEVSHPGSGMLRGVTSLWAKLPLKAANALGPRIRGHISA
jgi:FemAB-related protein (PEP-CTERM system-associated)